MNGNRIRILAVAILVLVGVGTPLLLPYLAVGTSVTATPVVAEPVPQPVIQPVCMAGMQEPYYYHREENKENPGSFGPTARSNYHSVLDGQPTDRDREVKAELWNRLCGTADHGGDESLLRAITAAAYGDDPNRMFESYDEWRFAALDFVDNEVDWANSNVVKTTLPSGTQTMYMYDDPLGTAPLIGLTEARQRESHFLLLHLKKGGMLTLRLECGYQPMGVNDLWLDDPPLFL